MPDTGAPWNIPYVESTDLVSAWPTASLALANAIDAGLDAADQAGIGSNVVHASQTTPFSTTSSSLVAVTDLSVSITPTSATSKILLVCYVGSMINTSVASFVALAMFRDGSQISSQNDVTLAATGSSGNDGFPAALVLLDSPATTSAITYQLYTRAVNTGTVYIGRPGFNALNNAMCTLTAIEVEA